MEPLPVDELVEAARRCRNRRPDPLLHARALAGIWAIRFTHADPVLTLSYVVWPTERVVGAQAAEPVASGTGEG